jgi:DNA-binding HxlR family transcriptional regulator
VRTGVHIAVPNSAVPNSSAALAGALERVGDRWTLLLIAALLDGPKRFGELRDEIPGLATNVLSSRLRELERQGLVVAVPYSRRPLRSDYQLSAVGAELASALRLLAAWGGGASGDSLLPTHAACGTGLHVRWWCPTCAQVVDDEDGEIWA